MTAYTNPIPLLTASKGLQPEMKPIVEETLIKWSSILQAVPFLTLESGFTYRTMEQVGNQGLTNFRALNEDYTDSHAEFKERAYGLAFLGNAMNVEKKIEKQIPGTLAKQVREHLEDLGSFIDGKFFNGSTATSEKEFDGLKRILGSSGSFVVTPGSDLSINASSSNFLSFLNVLDEAIRKVRGGPTAFFMRDSMYDAITSGARQLGANVLGSEIDFMGQMYTSYKRIPLVPFGNDNTGTAIFSTAETDAGGSGTQSIYAVRLGTDNGVCALSTSGIQYLPDEDNLFHRDVIDFDMGLKVTTNSAIRIARVKHA